MAFSATSSVASDISFSSMILATGITPRIRARTSRGAESNATNSSLLMKLNIESARDAGASSTRTNRTGRRLSASISSPVKSPSPDHPDASRSIEATLSFAGAVNRHEATEHGEPLGCREALREHAFGHRSGARITADRFRDVAVGVGVFVQRVPKHGADDREVGEIDRAHDGVVRSVEVERQEDASWTQHPMNLRDCGVDDRHIADAVSGRHDVEALVGERQ